MNHLTSNRLDGLLLGALGIILALVSWAALVALRVFAFGLPMSVAAVVTELILVALGSGAFWYLIIRMLNRQQREVNKQTERLQALHAATTSLTTEHELRPVLQKVVDLSRELIQARYGALGVLSEDGSEIDQFITSGISPAARARIGQLPIGHGLLGVSLWDGQSVRVANIAKDTRGAGLPDHHPEMHSFLSVPITSKGKIFGNLYLADKHSAADPGAGDRAQDPVEFTSDDQELLEMFAAQAAVAIEDAQLYRASRQIAVMRERERIGMDLHDGVIQSIYAIGLMLDDTGHRLREEPDLASERITNAIAGLNAVIRNIRAYIHDLRSPDYSDKHLQDGIDELILELEAYSVLEVSAEIDTEAVSHISQGQTSELLHIVQEALTNIRRHASANLASIALWRDDTDVVLTIEDDGVGFESAVASTAGGHGLHNMSERTHKVHGTLQMESAPGEGTKITVRIPLEANRESIRETDGAS